MSKKTKSASLHVMKKEVEKPAITKDTFPEASKGMKVPVLAGLPEYLKDPANYKKVRMALLDTLATTHSHSELIEWSACVNCQMKLRDHADMVRKLGFTSPAQYFAWRKISEQVDKRMKLR